MRGGRLREGPSRLLCTHCPQDIPKKSDAVGKGKVCEGQGGVLAQSLNRMELLIRDAKGQKDRVTMLSGALIEPLRAQRNAVGALLIRRHALATLS